MFINTENKSALETDTAVPLTHNLHKTESEKISKNENLALEIKSFRKLNTVPIYPLVISLEVVLTKRFLKSLENIRLTKNILRVGKNAVLLLRATYIQYANS